MLGNTILLTTRSPEEIEAWRRQSKGAPDTDRDVTFVPIITALDRIGIIDALATSLTPAMKTLILRGSAGGDECLGTVRACIRRKLMHIVVHSPNGRYGPCTLTDLGKAVQQRLQGKPNGR